MSRWLAFAPLAVLAVLTALFFGYSLRHDPAVRPDALVGKPVPAVQVRALADNSAVLLRTTVHGPALVNVFASWCVPCRLEHPILQGLKAKGVTVVGLAWKDKPAATRALLDELGDPYATVLTDQEGRAGIELGISGVPETYLVDAKGVIVRKWSAPLSQEDASAVLARLRAEQSVAR